MEFHKSDEEDFHSHVGKLKNHFDLNKLPDTEDSIEIESEIIEKSLDADETVEDSLNATEIATEIVEESDIESQEEGCSKYDMRKMQTKIQRWIPDTPFMNLTKIATEIVMVFWFLKQGNVMY
jgi:hypothetical protein